MDPTSLSSCPDELLLMVFWEVKELPLSVKPEPWLREWLSRPYLWILTITHVCQRWRALALETPSFWTTIDMQQPLECVNAFIERSKPLPLTLNMSTMLFGSIRLPDAGRLFLELPRCRSLEVEQGTLGLQLFDPIHAWRECAQSIESLVFVDIGFNSGSPDIPIRPPQLLTYELPSLKRLEWLGWQHGSFTNVICPRLTKLTFKSPNIMLPFTQWLTFLRDVPLLEELTLGAAIVPEPINPVAPRTRPDLVVQLPHLSSLKLSGNSRLHAADGPLGELALFCHLEFPVHTAIKFPPCKLQSSFLVLAIVERYLTQPAVRNRYVTTGPSMVAIERWDTYFHVSVWDVLSEPLAMCWQWETTRSHPPPPLLDLQFEVPAPDTPDLPRLYGRAMQVLNAAYPLHLVEALAFADKVSPIDHLPNVLACFRGLLQRLTGIRTLYLQGKFVDGLLAVLLKQPPAMLNPANNENGGDEPELTPQDVGTNTPFIFPSLRTISLCQDNSSYYYPTPYVKPAPSFIVICAALQERRINAGCRIDLMHLCGEPNPLFTKPGMFVKCGGATYDIADPVNPISLPIFGSDSSRRS